MQRISASVPPHQRAHRHQKPGDKLRAEVGRPDGTQRQTVQEPGDDQLLGANLRAAVPKEDERAAEGPTAHHAERVFVLDTEDLR